MNGACYFVRSFTDDGTELPSRNMAKRGSSISVPDSWLEQCRNWRDSKGLTIEQTGARLARVVKRGRPFAEATVRRYLNGSLVTDDLTQAFAQAMKVPPPVVIEDPHHREWYELGVRLDQAHSKLFHAERERLAVVVAMAEALDDDDSES